MKKNVLLKIFKSGIYYWLLILLFIAGCGKKREPVWKTGVDWAVYQGEKSSNQYSPLKQIYSGKCTITGIGLGISFRRWGFFGKDSDSM